MRLAVRLFFVLALGFGLAFGAGAFAASAGQDGGSNAPAPPTPPPAAPEQPVDAVEEEAEETGAAAGIEGAWNGVIRAPGQELTIGMVFRAKEGGEGLVGALDIPAQGAVGVPLDTVIVEGDMVKITMSGIPGAPTFEGKLEGDRIDGVFTQGDVVFPFELTRGAVEKPRRAQDPEGPFPYTSEEVSVRNGDVTLAGTLTRPEGEGPFPAVVLISGSGPQNRDEELFGHRPFAVWADRLSRAGVMVVRYDDRGVGESTGSLQNATSVDLAADTEAWVELLEERGDVSTIGLMGHSEGGLIAPMVAARNEDVGFVVLLAGPGVSGADTLAEQNRALMLAAGAPPEAAEEAAVAARTLFAAVVGGADDEEVRAKLRELVATQSGGAEIPEEIVERELARLRDPWFGFFLKHDPAADLEKLSIPVLAVFGGKDAQVVAEQHAPAMRAAFERAGNAETTVETLPGLNHLLQPAETGGVGEYARIETTVDESALEMVTGWIVERFGKGEGEEE